MAYDQLPVRLGELFTGVHATVESVNKLQKIYDSEQASRFNSLNFFRPGENKISEILAFFLDPKQTHGQGALFLDLFLKAFHPASIVCNRVCIRREYPTNEGKRIDIVMEFESGKHAVGIENKIWAKDLPKQLLHYSDFLNEKYNGSYVLFYLNPYKHNPSIDSIDAKTLASLKENKRLVVIDYSTQIMGLLKQWISHCKAETVKVFLNDFKQYLQKEINGEEFMNEHAIVADYILKDKEKVETAFLVEDSANTVRLAIIGRLLNQLNEFASKAGLKVKYDKSFEKQYSNFTFSNSMLASRHIIIGFEFQERYYNGFIYGIIRQKELSAENLAQLKNCLSTTLGINGQSTTNWPWYTFHDEYRNWNSKTFVDIYDGTFIKKVEQKVETILNAIASLDHSQQINTLTVTPTFI
jgi:hypothetical protein